MPLPAYGRPDDLQRYLQMAMTGDEPTEPGTGIVPPAPNPAPTPGPANLRPQEPGITSAPRPYNPDWQNVPYTGEGTTASVRAPRLTQTNGQWTLSEHGNQRPLQDYEVGNAQSYVDDFRSQNPTGFIQPGSPGYAPGQAMTNAGYGAASGATSGTTPPAATGTSTTGASSANRSIMGGNIGNVQGYDHTKFGDEGVQSLKYRAGRILSDYPTTEAGLRQALQDPRWLGDPDLAKATYEGGDKINFNGVLSDGTTGVPVNLVDVLQAFENGGSPNPWQWLDQNFAGDGAGQGGSSTGLSSGGGSALSALSDSGASSILEQIMAELNAAIRGRSSPTNQSTLQGMLQR